MFAFPGARKGRDTFTMQAMPVSPSAATATHAQAAGPKAVPRSEVMGAMPVALTVGAAVAAVGTKTAEAETSAISPRSLSTGKKPAEVLVCCVDTDEHRPADAI